MDVLLVAWGDEVELPEDVGVAENEDGCSMDLADAGQTWLHRRSCRLTREWPAVRQEDACDCDPVELRVGRG